MTTPDPQLVRDAANRLTAICEHFETYGEWPHNRSDSSDIADLRMVLARLKHLDSARDSAVREWKREHDAADELQRERDVLAARVAELEAERGRLLTLLGMGVDREQWDAIAEAEGQRFEAEQTNDTIVGYLAYRYEDMKAQQHILLREIEDQAAELKQLRSERISRELEDRHIDRTLGMLLMRLGGSVEFSQAEMENAPAHGEFVAMRNLAAGGTRLAFEPRTEVDGEATS